MEITNAKIKDVTVCFDDWGQLSVMMSFYPLHGCYNWHSLLKNPDNVQRLTKLMTYTESNELSDLNGKIIRIVKFNNAFCGFGHLIEDKFVPCLMQNFKEVNKLKFAEMFK